MPSLIRTEGGPWQGVSTREVRAWSQRMLRVLGLESAELSVLLCGDARIRELNSAYRGKDRPTDVLSFAMTAMTGASSAPGCGPALLGDVVISVETARRQASRSSDGLGVEVMALLAHGILHLVGFDHRTRTEERRMSACSHILAAAALGLSPHVGSKRALRSSRARRSGSPRRSSPSRPKRRSTDRR